jgi:hypothetical protein
MQNAKPAVLKVPTFGLSRVPGLDLPQANQSFLHKIFL